VSFKLIDGYKDDIDIDGKPGLYWINSDHITHIQSIEHDGFGIFLSDGTDIETFEKDFDGEGSLIDYLTTETKENI